MSTARSVTLGGELAQRAQTQLGGVDDLPAGDYVFHVTVDLSTMSNEDLVASLIRCDLVNAGIGAISGASTYVTRPATNSPAGMSNITFTGVATVIDPDNRIHVTCRQDGAMFMDAEGTIVILEVGDILT